MLKKWIDKFKKIFSREQKHLYDFKVVDYLKKAQWDSMKIGFVEIAWWRIRFFTIGYNLTTYVLWIVFIIFIGISIILYYTIKEEYFVTIVSAIWSCWVFYFLTISVPRWQNLQIEVKYFKQRTQKIPNIFFFALKTYFWFYYLSYLHQNSKLFNENTKNITRKDFLSYIEMYKNAAESHYFEWYFEQQFSYLLNRKQASRLNWLNFYKEKINVSSDKFVETTKFFASFKKNVDKKFLWK